MDVTYDEYINFINHLVMQELLDFAYFVGQDGSTADSLTILE
jgi:hypothetical protein